MKIFNSTGKRKAPRDGNSWQLTVQICAVQRVTGSIKLKCLQELQLYWFARHTKPEAKRPQARSGFRRGDNIKIDIKERVCVGIDWIQPAQDWDQWQTLLKTVTNIRFPQKNGSFLKLVAYELLTKNFFPWSQLYWRRKKIVAREIRDAEWPVIQTLTFCVK